MLLFSSMIKNSAHLNQFYVKTTAKAECFTCGEPSWWRKSVAEKSREWTACLIGMYHLAENCSALWYRPWAANRYPSLATRLCFWSKEDHNSICTVAVMYWVGVVYRTVRTVKFESGHGFIIKRTLELLGVFFESLSWMKLLKFLMCSVNYLSEKLFSMCTTFFTSRC